MSDFLERISKLSPKRLALLALEQHEQLQDFGARAHEPIAVVGMGCRFPGSSDDPAAFWDLLVNGREGIREVPPDRWDIDAWFDPDPDARGRMSARAGGFLPNVDRFDATFFGISPREALTMDPQQRLLLEVTWEALEDAGIPADGLARSATGVFVGVCNSDHFQRLLSRGPDVIDAYLASGSAHSVAAGRLAYFLGTQGPALAIDTACSSSLVALHQAIRSLRSGECTLAIAGGVNVMCSPETSVALSKAHMLAPDGRCKTFDASADGFSRGEGCGVLVLKRLADARESGDRILALLRGSAINQDGRSGGLTVPNGPAQEAVIGAALADSQLQPGDIDYVEAHGTGTSLGDPIELRALALALARGRAAESPLQVGSVKTNIGHLESAAGIAGVIKVVLSLQHETIPPHLHFRQPNPHIDWQLAPVRVTSEAVPWQRTDRPRRAGVSSFGFSGTNAHVIVEEAAADRSAAADGNPADGASRYAERPMHVIPLSARTPVALAALASRMAERLTDRSDLADVACSAATGRSHFVERAAIVAPDVSTAREALAALAAGETHPSLHRGTAEPGKTPEVVFLFTGQGSQYPGMGRQLYECSPVFREVIDRCDASLGEDAQGRSLLAVLHGGVDAGTAAAIHETAWTQPALFALEMATVALWRSWGIEPAAAAGHSVGEYAAACAAGVFSLEDGLRLIAERGRLMQGLPSGGAMAAVFASREVVSDVLAAHRGTVAIAAINADDSVVISGDAEAVDGALAGLAKRSIEGKRLMISVAAHSQRVEPILDAFEASAARIPMSAPALPVAWNVSGGAPLPGGAPDPRYWRRQMREPVRFGEGIRALHGQGYRFYLEVGPHPTLVALAQRSLPESGSVTLGSLRRNREDWAEMLASLAELYVRGAAIDWSGFDAPYMRRRARLPSYPFERRSFWVSPTLRPSALRPSASRSLHGSRVSAPTPIYEKLLTPDSLAGLRDHRVQGVMLVAAPVLLEMAQSAARALRGSAARGVRDFHIREALVLPEEGRVVQQHLIEDGRDIRFEIHSRRVEGDDDEAWRLHAAGRLVPLDAAAVMEAADSTGLDAIRDTLGGAVACDAYYDVQLRDVGIELGAGFRSLVRAHRRVGEVLAEIELPATATGDEITSAHPALLDGALQSIGVAVPEPKNAATAYLLTTIGRLDLVAPLPSRLWCHARILNEREIEPAEWKAEVTLRSAEGRVLGIIHGVRLQRATRQALARSVRQDDAGHLFHSLAWEPAPLAPVASTSLVGPSEFAAHMRERFDSLADEHGLSIYDQLLPELDRLSFEHVVAAFQALGFDATPARRFSADTEADLLRIDGAHRRLFARLLAILAEEGVLRAHGNEFEVVAPFRAVSPATRYDELFARFAATDGELRTLRRCGPELARVLRGEQDPLQLLFPGGSFAEARKLYVESPFARTYNSALVEALQAALRPLPAGARLRVLEVGAGTGGTTAYVLPTLPADRCDYCFTDLSPMFLERAAENFAAYPFLRGKLLDIERDPLTQGFEPGSFDVVIASNVLHATADLESTLRNVRRLMAPGALLLLLEGVTPERWVDLSFGLTDGWWRFSDASLRPDYPLIARGQWKTLLEGLGFDDVEALPGADRTSRAASQQALIVARHPTGGRQWIVAGDGNGLGAALVESLSVRGARAVLATSVDDTVLSDGCDFVYLGGIEATVGPESGPQFAQRSSEQALRWHQRVSARGGRSWIVTRHAQRVADGPLSLGAAWQAPLWGLGRGIALEDPAAFGGLIDLPEDDAHANAGLLAHALLDGDAEDQCAWCDGSRYALRLEHASPPPPIEFTARGDGCYLVTGGFGGLGLVAARWLVERGAKYIALLGRHPDLTSEAVRAMQAAGATVTGLQADVADGDSLAQALAQLRRSGPPLRGVLHAAADLHSAPVQELDAARLRSMFAPKVDGSVFLERATRDIGVDFLVLFSSTTALLGAAGLAHYAAANAFLDTFAVVCDSSSRRVLSVNWGTWEVMRLATAEEQRNYRAGGLLPIRASEALESLGRLLAAPPSVAHAQTVVANIDWAVLKPLLEIRRKRPLLARLDAAPVQTVEPSSRSGEAGPSLADRLATAPAGMRRDLIVEFVQREVAGVLGLGDPASVPLATGLFDLGMDSLMSVELKRRLERGAARALPATLTFNYPNVEALAGFLESLLIAQAVTQSAPAASAASVSPVGEGPLDDSELDALTDDELEARLVARLEQAR